MLGARSYITLRNGDERLQFRHGCLLGFARAVWENLEPDKCTSRADAFSSNVRAVSGGSAHFTTTTCCAFDQMRDDRDAAQECRGDSYARPARRNAELPCGRFGPTEPLWSHIDLIPQMQKSVCQRDGQLGDVSQTSSLWLVARILSADCSKMPRIHPLTIIIPGLKIKNLVPFSGTTWKTRSRP